MMSASVFRAVLYLLAACGRMVGLWRAEGLLMEGRAVLCWSQLALLLCHSNTHECKTALQLAYVHFGLLLQASCTMSAPTSPQQTSMTSPWALELAGPAMNFITKLQLEWLLTA